MYRHQQEAIEQALNGRNVVLQAPTASGKTLAFQVPMVETLLADSKAHALMIYPTKALAFDQRDQLMRLAGGLPKGRIESWWYDGDIDQATRKALRAKPPSILITNPEMLNLTFLGHSDQWQSFLRNLRWVVLDEMHEYRGYFGSNVSLLLRRFSHHLEQMGVRPQFFLSSATCANAQEHAQNLTGLDFVEVNAANSMRPNRKFSFIQPDVPDFQYWEILQLRTVKAALACLYAGKSVLVFCPTRKFAETCYPMAMREIERLGEDKGIELDPTTVRVFRSGLSTDERHEIQQGLKDESVRVVFSTNALELGIDIGGLDGVILAGFPDSMMSAWQRIGRAGRSWSADSFVIYFARNNPMDAFYASNLPTFLDKPLDDLVVSPENEDLIEHHIPALLYETPDIAGAESILGPAFHQAAKEKLRSGAKPVRTGRWRPHSAIAIRGGGGGKFVLKDGTGEIGTLSGQQKFREAYPRAIYLHGGRRYRVKEISLTGDGGEIHLVPEEPFLRTNPSLFTTLSEVEIYGASRWTSGSSDVSVFHGKVLMMESLSSVEEVNERTGDVVDRWAPEPGSGSTQFDNAHACWVACESRSESPGQGIAELQHLLRLGALFTIPLDAHDVVPHCDLRERKAYLVESVPGGIGIAVKARVRWRDMLNEGVKIAEQCSCVRGCPLCIVPPRSREELDKRLGVELAQELLEATVNPADEKFANGLWVPV